MKKLLFSAYSLDVGGIETALITLLNKLVDLEYDITLVLEKKQGIFLEQLSPKVKVIEYTPSECKIVLFRKMINMLKRTKFSMKYKDKYDFSASFATYSLAGAFVARVASKNSALWGHADYLTLFKGNEKQVKYFFEEREVDKFKHIVFVSNEGRKSFLKFFPQLEARTIVCNNLINYNKILEMSQEKNDERKDKSFKIFLNVSRHDEYQKKLTRLIKAARKLKEENYKFKVLMVGDGQDTEMYKKMVEKYKMQTDIIFVGRKKNPYPYFNISDCVILTSDYEGYPVVFLESMLLNKPIITTKVSDYDEIEGKFGYTTEKTVEDIYEKMKLFLEEGFEIKEKFDAEKYNTEIIKKLENIF